MGASEKSRLLFLAKGGSKMKSIAMAGKWSEKAGPEDMQPALQQHRRYLEGRMLAASTIESYLNRVKLFLLWAKTDEPSINQSEDYRQTLRKKNMLSSYNNCCWAIQQYYAVLGREVIFTCIKPKMLFLTGLMERIS